MTAASRPWTRAQRAPTLPQALSQGLTNGLSISERDLDGELHLPGIPDALAQEAVEVEQRRRRERVHVVGVVERVEHLRARDDLGGPHLERPLHAPVEGEEGVVLPIPV